MTEPAAAPLESQPSSSPLSWLVQAWVESFAQVLGQIAGSPLACVVLPEAPSELAPPGAGDLWVIGACSGGLRGEMSLRLPPLPSCGWLRFS